MSNQHQKQETYSVSITACLYGPLLGHESRHSLI